MKVLFTGLYTRLKAAVTGITDIYNALAPQSATYPFMVMSIFSDVSTGTLTEDEEDNLVQLDIYDDDSSSSDILDIYETLKTALDKKDANLTVAGYSVIWLNREGGASLKKEEDKGKQIWRLSVTYRILIEKN